MLLLLSLLACDGLYPSTTDTEVADTDSQDLYARTGCSTTIERPTLGGQTDDVVDAHAETFGAEPAPYAVHLGSASNDPSTAASWVWRTDGDTLATQVQYGIDSLDQQVDGVSFTFGTDDAYRVHEVRLCEGLEPATTYQYRVGGEGNWSETFTFTTAPEPGTQTFTMAFAGDSRSGYDTWAELLAGIDAHDPDFILFSGDLVETGTEQDEWDEWFAAGDGVLARVPLFPAHGNHEYLAVNYFAQFSLPYNEQWYDITWGDLSLVVLNDFAVEEGAIDELQPAFMDEVWARHDQAHPTGFKMASHHAATYSANDRHGSNEYLRALWAPVWDDNDVDMVIAGHNHTYERSQPVRGEAVDSTGTVHLVSGGAGAPLYDGEEEEWFSAASSASNHFGIAEFSSTGIDVTVYDLSGDVIDSFSLAR